MAEHVTSVDIDAAPEIVFEHLVSPEGMLAWMGQHAELEPVSGGTFSVDINGSPIRGQYLEVDPPRRVVVSWGVAGNDELPPGSSRVEFTLTPQGRGTRLELVHSGLPASRAPMHERGWTHFLARLQVAAVGTDPGPDPWAADAARELFDELVAEHLTRPGVSLGRMMNTDGLKVNGKFFALASRGRLVVKVPAAQAAELRANAEAVAFEPSPGRPMKEWVALDVPVPPTDASLWTQLMADARDYVESLTPNRN